MFRLLLLCHRYLGIACGIIVALWCLSGFVMMYVPYPALTDEEARAGLEPLDLSGCCAPPGASAGAPAALRDFSIEMLAGEPVLRIAAPAGPQTIALRTGRPIPRIDAATARDQALRHLANAGIRAAAGKGEWIERDQWTVSGAFQAHRPLYRFDAGDAARTAVYVSGTTGEVVQRTTGRERRWNMLGAVVHWVYPVILRQHPRAWQQTIIWTSVAGIFLVVTGLYVGLLQFRKRGNGRRSPYRGAALWHHYAGLVFGVLTLTWLASGLLSVNPWGLLESEGAYRAPSPAAASARDELPPFLAELRAYAAATAVVRVESAPSADRPAVLAFDGRGGFLRLDARSFSPRPFSSADLEAATELLAAGRPIASAALMDHEDGYWFAHHAPAALPVWRVILADAERTRFYVDPRTGRLLRAVDRNGRWFRWLFEAAHRGDFHPTLRRRPVWDVAMLVLLLGVTVSALTGAYLAVRRVARAR